MALKLIAECGTDLTAWPSSKYSTPWLCLAPGNKVSGGKVLSSPVRQSAASTLATGGRDGRQDGDGVGAFYRHLSTRIGKAQSRHRNRLQDCDAVP
nr:hypothetical protein [Phyllobacterium endophyticum]